MKLKTLNLSLISLILSSSISYSEIKVGDLGVITGTFGAASQYVSKGVDANRDQPTANLTAEFASNSDIQLILGAGILKVPDLFQPENQHLAGPIIAGSIVSFFATYFSISFLVRWFKTNTLYPFAIYCLIFGALSIVRFSI